MHDVDDENRNIAETAATAAQIGEGLVPGGVNDKKAGDVKAVVVLLVELCRSIDEGFAGEKRGANLLRNAACLSTLDVRRSDSVEKTRLPRVDVAENTTNRRPQTGHLQFNFLLDNL